MTSQFDKVLIGFNELAGWRLMRVVNPWAYHNISRYLYR